MRGLNGAEGLLCAVIARATKDAAGHDHGHAVDALAYFAGPSYQHHMTALGLPPEYTPVVFENENTLHRVIDLVLENEYEPKQEI